MSPLYLRNVKQCLYLSRNLLNNSNKLVKPHFVSSINVLAQHANYCSKPSENLNRRQRSLPPLMNFPEIVWPSLINSIKNWVMIHFIIRPYFDNEFNLKDFIFGAQHAVQLISSKLMSSKLMELKDLVSQEVINEIKPAIEKMSVSQRNQLEIFKEDIYLSFPYQVGIMFDESNEAKQKRFVEITMVFHVLRGFKEMQKQGEALSWNMGSMPEYSDRVFVCNYRFIKEFTAGSETDWTVNIVNHFKPADLLLED